MKKRLKFWVLLILGGLAAYVLWLYVNNDPCDCNSVFNNIPGRSGCFNQKEITYTTKVAPTSGNQDSTATRTDFVRYRCNEWILDGNHPNADSTRKLLREWDFCKVESCPCPGKLELWRYAGKKKVLGISSGGEVVVDPSKKGNGVGGLELNYVLIKSPAGSFKGNEKPQPSPNEKTCPSNRVKIAIVDTGVEPNNSQLLATAWNAVQSPLPPCDSNAPLTQYGLNIMGNNAIGWEPLDDNGHGTHINGIVSGVAPNGGDRMGVPFDILNVKVLDSNNECTLFDAMCGLYYAIAQDVDVINISWGFKDTIAAPEIFIPFFAAAKSKNIVVVAGLGNDSINVDGDMKFWPACFANTTDNLISVAALNSVSGNLASFSNWSFSGDYMTVAALGKNVLSAYPVGLRGNTSGLAFMSGTSMAAPFVTRTVAVWIGLAKGSGRAYNARQIKDWILNNAFPVNDHAVHRRLNHSGRINCPCPSDPNLCRDCEKMECPTALQ